MNVSEKAQMLVDQIGGILEEQVGPAEDWPSADRQIYECAEQLARMVRSLDTKDRLNRLEEAVRELNPGAAL